MQYLLWIFARLVNPMRQIMPSWTDFFISVRDNVVILESTVGHFKTINASTTEMSIQFMKY